MNRHPILTFVLGTLIGALATGSVWLLKLPGEINAFNQEYPKLIDWWNLNSKITGTWTSNIEGSIDATDEDRRLQGGAEGPVVIQIRVYGGAADGEIYSEGLKNNYVASRIFLKGNAHGSERVDGVIYDYIGGEPKALAQIKLTYSKSEGMERLLFATSKQGGPFLPQEAKLHRDDNAMPDDLGGLSPWWVKTLLDYTAKHKKAQ